MVNGKFQINAEIKYLFGNLEHIPVKNDRVPSCLLTLEPIIYAKFHTDFYFNTLFPPPSFNCIYLLMKSVYM